MFFENNGQSQDDVDAMQNERTQCKMKIPWAEMAEICNEYIQWYFLIHMKLFGMDA